MAEDKPRYEHHCPRCCYLYTADLRTYYDNDTSTSSDFYYCEAHKPPWEINYFVRRYGPAPRNQTSLWTDARWYRNYSHLNHYIKAAILAGEKGLIDKCTIDTLIGDLQ